MTAHAHSTHTKLAAHRMPAAFVSPAALVCTLVLIFALAVAPLQAWAASSTTTPTIPPISSSTTPTIPPISSSTTPTIPPISTPTTSTSTTTPLPTTPSVSVKDLSPDTWGQGLPLITDQPGLLTADQKAALQSRAEIISEKYKCNIYILVVKDMRNYSTGTISAFTNDVRTSYKLGYSGTSNALILVMDAATRQYDITSAGILGSRVFNEPTREWIADNIIGSLKANDWNTAFIKYLDTAEYALSKYDQGTPIGRPNNAVHILVSILICLIIGFVIALLIASAIRRRSKSVHASTHANSYIKADAIDITYRNDQYCGTTQTRVYAPRQKNKNGGGGGGFIGGGHGHTGGRF